MKLKLTTTFVIHEHPGNFTKVFLRRFTAAVTSTEVGDSSVKKKFDHHYEAEPVGTSAGIQKLQNRVI